MENVKQITAIKVKLVMTILSAFIIHFAVWIYPTSGYLINFFDQAYGGVTGISNYAGGFTPGLFIFIFSYVVLEPLLFFIISKSFFRTYAHRKFSQKWQLIVLSLFNILPVVLFLSLYIF